MLQTMTDANKELSKSIVEDLSKLKALNGLEISDEEYEWLNGHPDYSKRSNPFKKENFEQILKFLAENDPDYVMGKILSESINQ